VPGAVSTGHVPLAPEAVTPALIDAWKDAALPARQRALVDGELREMYRGPVPPLPFDVLRAALAPLVRAGDSVLEIGCSSGYYAEVLRYLLHQPLDFTGVDYSPAMIAMARAEYPTTKFLVADGANLPFPDRSFDVAISSSVLLHVRDYPLHVAETTRVARNVVVAHRIPVCRRRPTTFLKKRGYDIEMMEIVFNERELLDLFLAAGLELVDGLQYHADDAADTFGVTYVFRKR
jgi:SAM-dependent methyltransferase